MPLACEWGMRVLTFSDSALLLNVEGETCVGTFQGFLCEC